MRYSEKDNFNRVIHWNSPSHVCYPPPSAGVMYAGAGSGAPPSPAASEWQDEWGVTWRMAQGEAFPAVPAISGINELDRLRVPDPRAPARWTETRQKARQVNRTERFLAVNHSYFLYEKAFNLLGAEEFLAALADEQETAHCLLDRIVDFELGIAAEYVKLKPDHVNFSDDYGMQDRLAVSPETWREFFKPRLKRVMDFYYAELGPDITVSLHSCGHVMPILEDLIEIGVRILNPVQSAANDLAELRRRASRKLVLCGGIDGQRVLPLGTPEDVAGEVNRKMDLLWEDGGYLPMAEKTLGVSKENLQAMEAAIRAWSREHVENGL